MCGQLLCAGEERERNEKEIPLQSICRQSVEDYLSINHVSKTDE